MLLQVADALVDICQRHGRNTIIILTDEIVVQYTFLGGERRANYTVAANAPQEGNVQTGCPFLLLA